MALIAVVVAVALLAGSGDSGGSASGDVLPGGGSVPEIDTSAGLAAAARSAGCELKSYRATSRRHVGPGERVDYASKPPTSGPHYPPPAADDGAYEDSPDVRKVVHSMEHGRVIVWFRPRLPTDERAALKAYFDDDGYQLLLVPDTTGMRYEVAATAWSKEPEPNGTGRLLGCPRYDEEIFTAIEAFKDEHRSRGPEPVP